MSKDWHSDFAPSYTPMEMLDLGVFEGIYTQVIKGIPSKYTKHKNLVEDTSKPDIEINQFKIKSRQSLKKWQENGWVTKDSPLGWWEWYIKYYEGRRLDKEDDWQIKRWRSFVARHSGQLRSNCKLSDLECSPKQRQGLLQWAWDSSTEFTDTQLKKNLKRIANSAGAKLATEELSILSW